MAFDRLKSPVQLTASQKRDLLNDYFTEYREQAADEKGADFLNRKIPRGAFDELLHKIGELVLEEARKLALQEGAASQFLNDNPLPPSLEGKLPRDFRVFCLALNALKQWVAAEQMATDRYLLGGTARSQCRKVAKHCILSGEALDAKTVELHHPVRDGRPPVPVSKAAHARIERQVSSDADGSLRGKLLEIKRNAGRSWIHLRRGCRDLLGHPVEHSTSKVGASSRSFARRASKETATTYQALLDWLDKNKLG